MFCCGIFVLSETYPACCRGAADPMERDDVGKTLSMAGLRMMAQGYVRDGKLWPAAMMTTQFLQTNRVGACARIKFKHLKLNTSEGMTHPEPIELVEFACVNQKRAGHHRFFKALCAPHVDPTVCPVWYVAAQLVAMYERMPGILQSIATGEMVQQLLPDFATGGTVPNRQPLWWGYSLYPAGNSSSCEDPARGQLSDQIIWRETRGQLDQLPEDERPLNCTHSFRYGGLQNAQVNGCSEQQQLKQGGWKPGELTMKDRYDISIEDRDASMRVSGQAPANGEPPKNNHIRPRHWPSVKAKLVKAGYAREIEVLEQGIFPGLDAVVQAVTKRNARVDAGAQSFTTLLAEGEEGWQERRDGNALPFLRLLEYLRGMFLAGAWAILEMQGSEATKQLPCFRHPVFLEEHMSLDPAKPSWFRTKLGEVAKEDAAERRRLWLKKTAGLDDRLGDLEERLATKLDLVGKGKRAMALEAKAALVEAQAAAAAPVPPSDLPLTYAPAGSPKVVQWPTKISSVQGIWSVWDGGFRDNCLLTPDRHYTDLDSSRARWPDKGPGNKNPGSSFNPHIKALVRYMDRLVLLEQHRNPSLQTTWQQAAAEVIPKLEDAKRDCGKKVAISVFYEGIYLLMNKPLSSTTRNGDLSLSTLSEALTKAPRWLALPAAAVA